MGSDRALPLFFQALGSLEVEPPSTNAAAFLREELVRILSVAAINTDHQHLEDVSNLLLHLKV